MRLLLRRSMILFLALALPPRAGVAVEAWVDPNLTEREGLALWLDAAAQPRARESAGQLPLDDALPAGEVIDGAAGVRFTQADAEHTPSWHKLDNTACLRFLGATQHLAAALGGDRRKFDEITVFLVAAPFHNEGDFTGLLAMHAADAADFITGLNIDLGPTATSDFAAVNVEGAGFGGQKNLRTGRGPFSKFHRLCVTSKNGPGGVALFVDGQPEGRRDRADSTLAADRVIIGGRYTKLTPDVERWFAGDLAEVIVYDRVLDDARRQTVDAYLAAKYDGVAPPPPPLAAQGERRLTPVESPPLAQMHVPGFTVRQLPVTLPNINNVLYREDGCLVALAYDGNVYLLRDTDGDGLEDDARLFWKNEGQLRAPIGMALTPPGYERGRGVFVPSKSKLSLLLDADGDDVAEQEIVVATGWPELWTQVDALGAAVDPRDGSICFGLGTWNFANGHQVGDDGVAKYRLEDEHGTILRVAPDFKSRQIVATGIRFPVGIRFNKDGELFCTDQEGATWLPNGNPFDELLHVQQGRHYGFPPRHPRHLPGVIDEPSVFDYRPQHQSTCGLNFNEPAIDGSLFGPDWWRSDALVTGFSRGKLYRTRLARAEHGYVAQNTLIGTTGMMPSDACPGPGRSLVVAMHSGGPDWGSGPAGEGKLLKVTYDPAVGAMPSLVWAFSPREVRIAFDRPVDPELLKKLAERMTIDGGEYVAAADRFESFRPGYAVVKQQRFLPRLAVDVQGVQLTADRRTLIVTTAPHRSAVSYSITLPGLAPPVAGGEQPPAIEQHPDVDLQYDLCGVEAIWQGDDGASWRGWLPTLDLDVAQDFTRESAEHDELWPRLRGAGTLTLRTAVDLRDMLHPALQPGTKIDYEPAPEAVTLTVKTDAPSTVELDGQPGEAIANADAGDLVYAVSGTAASRLLQVVLKKSAGPDAPRVSLAYSTNEDPRPRALPLRRMRLPWAEQDAAAHLVDNRDLPELAGGSWLRGEREFYGSEAGCSKCHSVRGVGAAIGPDLSNLPQRDYASVLRDVTQPSFAVNPDFVSQTVLLKEGRVLAGTVRVDGDRMTIADQEGKETVIHPDDVEMLEHSPQSIMPEGIPKALGEARMRDLLTFLLVAPPTMPVYGELPPPPPRRLPEVDAVLAGGAPPADPRPLHVVLVAGAKDHGPGEHDYPAWKAAWKQLLEMAEGVRVTTADDWPAAEDLQAADALVFFQKGDWTPGRASDLDAFLARGGGASFIHYAVDGGADGASFAERIGLAWQGGRSKFRHGPLDVDFVTGDHPIARNFDQVHFYDESYWNSVGDPRRINLLATGVEEGEPRPLFWTREHGGGRVFVSIPGHYSWTFDDPLYRILLLRGLAWTAGESVDRFNALCLPGARVRRPAP